MYSFSLLRFCVFLVNGICNTADGKILIKLTQRDYILDNIIFNRKEIKIKKTLNVWEKTDPRKTKPLFEIYIKSLCFDCLNILVF